MTYDIEGGVTARLEYPPRALRIRRTAFSSSPPSRYGSPRWVRRWRPSWRSSTSPSAHTVAAGDSDTPWLLYTVIGVSAAVIVGAIPLLTEGRQTALGRGPAQPTSPGDRGRSARDAPSVAQRLQPFGAPVLRRHSTPPAGSRVGFPTAAVEQIWLRCTATIVGCDGCRRHGYRRGHLSDGLRSRHRGVDRVRRRGRHHRGHAGRVRGTSFASCTACSSRPASRKWLDAIAFESIVCPRP